MDLLIRVGLQPMEELMANKLYSLDIE